jgi:hypothetical protein
MRNIFFALVFLISFKTYSQSISVFPDTVSINTYGNIYETGIAYLPNLTSDTLHLRWIRDELNVQPTWVNSICDNNVCHSTTDDTADFFIAPNDTGFIEMQFDPNDADGDGIIKVFVFSPVDSANINATVVFRINVNDLNTVNEIKNSGIKCFQNQYGNLEVYSFQSSINSYELFDLSGRIILNEREKNVSAFSIDESKLSSGIYLLRLFIESGNVVLKFAVQ